MKKKHRVKFKPLQELYDRSDTLLNSKAVGLFKVSLKESTIDHASVVDRSRNRKVTSLSQLPCSEASNMPSISCQSSYSEDFQSLVSLKAPGSSKYLPPMLQHVTTFQKTVEHQGQDAFDCQGEDNSCISKDDGAVMISSDHFGGADHKIVTSSAASISSFCPDVLVESLNGQAIKNGSPVDSTPDPHLDNQNLMCEDRSESSDALVDVSLCDICGDVGREVFLALCSSCSDGAEHIYCMTPKMEQVPEGDWFCEECLLMQNPKRQRQVVVERSDNVSKTSCSKEQSQGSPKMSSVIRHEGKMKLNQLSKASCLSDMRLGPSIDVRSETKKEIAKRSIQPLSISGSGGKAQLAQVSSLKNVNKRKDAARQVSSYVFLPAKKLVKQACSSDHRSPKPQQSCGGSLLNNKAVDNSDLNMEVRCSREVIHQKRKPVKDKADCVLKMDQPDKKVLKSLSLTGVSSIPPDMSNTQSSVPTIKRVRYGNGRNSTEKNSLENNTTQVVLPSSGSSSSKVSSYRTKVDPKVVKVAHSPRKNVEDKTTIQVNGNANVKALGSLVYEGKICVNAPESVKERKLPCNASYAISSPAKNVNAYPDQRMSLSTKKSEFDDIVRDESDHSVAYYKALPPDFQHVTVMPTLDPVEDIDQMVPNFTSVVPESRCIWKGKFKLEKSGELPTDCYGVQAHLSTHASSKIVELALKFSNELLLNEVPRLHTWPIQYRKIYPTEQDIALYFFAQDSSSYGRNYRMLLEGMMNRDLALEANFGDFQLLVFPSSLLPVTSQCWNSLPYLWGVFRVRKIDDVHTPSSLNVASVNQDLYSPDTCGSESKFISAPVSSSSLASCTSHNSLLGPESASLVVLQSAALIKSGDQSIEQKVPSLKKHIGTLENPYVQADTIISACDWRKEDSGGGLHSDDLQNGNRFFDEDLRSASKTDIIQCGLLTREHIASIGFCADGCIKGPSFTRVDDSTSDFWPRHVIGGFFSLDLRSSDVGVCAKPADELDEEPLEKPQSYSALNLDLCLGNRSGSEEMIDLDLVLGLPNRSDYQPKDSFEDGSKRDENVSLVLSLGVPCSTR